MPSFLLQVQRLKPTPLAKVAILGRHPLSYGAIWGENLSATVSRLPYLAELIGRKLAGPEKGKLPDQDCSFHRAEYERLRAELEVAMNGSALPDAPSCRRELDDLLIRIRTRGLGHGAAG